LARGLPLESKVVVVTKENKRLIFLLAILVVLLLCYLGWRLFSRRIRVEVSRDQIVKSNFYFIPEHWKEKKLEQLRKNETFKDISGKDQLDLFLKYCDWTHRQWKHSNPNPYPLSNAIDILADIRSGKTGGLCGQYSYVLADVLKSMGYFSVRYVELVNTKWKFHFVVEVWSDQYQKWMVLDPDANIYYEFKESGIPANAYEIQSSFLASDNRIVARSADSQRASLGNKQMDMYANFAVSLRSDLMRHPTPLTIEDRFAMFLFFKPDRAPLEPFKGRIPYAHITSRIEDIYFDCNCVRVEYQINRKQKVADFRFFTDSSMFNFREIVLLTSA